MTGPADLTRLVPGFDFLQGLMKNASAGIPAMGQWIAPTLDPEELDKRIQELKTVHFWLEQNARLLATTIQALEVQRMTLSTLKTMNLPLADLTESLKIRMPAQAAKPAAVPQPQPEPAAEPAGPAEAPAAAPAVDPLQWWGALTQQFTEIATKAVREGANQAAGLPGGGPLAAAMGQLAAGARQAAGKAKAPAKAAAPARAAKRARPSAARKKA